METSHDRRRTRLHAQGRQAGRLRRDLSGPWPADPARNLGAFHGYFTSEIGEPNHVVAWWSYASLDDRQARRARMSADPLWQAYLDKVVDLIQLQNTRILQPTAFSPLR
jgi:hypothetical protein